MKAFRLLWLLGAMVASAPGRTMEITDLAVDKTALRPGDTFTVSVAAGGGANFCLRHDRFGRPVLPGWREHGADYAFLPSTDFSGSGPYKNPENCHKENGACDTDPRDGVFRWRIETAGWPEGVYEFQVMATNRPDTGEYVGDARTIEITVGDDPLASREISRRFGISVNGRRVLAEGPGRPIYPGRLNRLTVRPRGDGAALPRVVTLTRIQPDGRETRASAALAEDAPEAVVDLGLFAVPAAFEFDSGVLYRRGCRFRLEIGPERGEPIETVHFMQTIDDATQTEVLAPGDASRVPHFGGRPGGAKPMDPPILLWLSPEVLSEPDDVRVCFQLRAEEKGINPEQSLASISGTLRVTKVDGDELILQIPVTAGPEVATRRLDVSGWEEARYRIEIIPDVEGTTDREGPFVVYRRRHAKPTSVRLSPLAPWEFERDDSREEIVVEDFRKAVKAWSEGPPDDATWEFRETAPGKTAIVTPAGDWRRPPVVLRPKLHGTYAVFATTQKGNCYLRVGRRGIVRGISAETAFVDAADLTGEEIAIYPASVPGCGLRRLRLVPVTAASERRVREKAAHPPVALRGVADWCDYFAPPSVHHSAGARLDPDQFDALLAGHAELGMRSIAWAIGRSWVEYHSMLPATTRFPCRPLETIDPKFQHAYAGRTAMINNQDPLATVLQLRERYALDILPWLAMQRHYGENAYGGIFCSDWFRAHPEWRRWNKGASVPSGSTVSYYFPEVRKERVDIYCEVAERSPDGLVIGWCRQVPMILYHPEMVAEYQAKTGIDPLKIDASHEKEYGEWIRWRADFVTETLRELKTRLEPIREKTGRPIPVVVRIPSKGIFYNMAQGLDVETWCREGLIHEIQLDPLEDCGWRGEPHDVRPYLELGRRYELPIYGGINGNTFWNPTAILRRAAGLLDAGVAGIEIYESNNFAAISPRRWMLPLLGNREELRRFLNDSNLDAVHPVWSRDAASGYDNHSFSGNWSVHGLGGNSL